MTDVLVSDGSSAGAGFIVGAVAAAASGPVAPFTFIGAIAAEAGMGSAFTYFSSSNC